ATRRTIMDRLTSADLQALVQTKTSPCVSLFLATQRGGAEQDVIRGKEMLREAEQQLIDGGMRSPDAANLVRRASEALGAPEFWRNASDGLALFLTSGSLTFFRLPLALPNQVVIAPHFHVKPL